MYIEIFKGKPSSAKSPQAWRWHFKNKGRITADAEAFPTKTHAIRAAKACVRATIKEFDDGANHVFFRSMEIGDVTRIAWANRPADLW